MYIFVADKFKEVINKMYKRIQTILSLNGSNMHEFQLLWFS